MSITESWQLDLQWLLANAFVGHGGIKALADRLRVNYQTTWAWTKGLRRPDYDNRKALRMVRQIHEGGER